MKSFLGFILASICFVVNAQTVEFVVTASPGGPNDTLSRKIAEKLDAAGVSTVIINKPGAAHMIGYNYILNTDKPTLFVSTDTIPMQLRYKSVAIKELGRFSNYVYVASNSGVASYEDLLALSKTRQINFGHGGIGTYSFQAMEQVCQKVDCLPVPYKSGADGMVAMLSGTIDTYALISYGAEAFEGNPNYKRILKVKPNNSTNWVILFGRNLPENIVSKVEKAVSQMEKIK